MVRLLACTVLLLLSTQGNAVIETYEFSDENTRERYHVLVDELRCPKCQNQNLSGSNSPIAKDLRRELHRLLKEGKSDKEIKQYMVARYGEYILYRPRLSNKTLLLWAAPLSLLLLGLALLLIVVRRRHQAAGTVSASATVAATDSANELSAEEQARLNKILETDND
jgi:cytochrome c-type biogenesis protein CcmH